MNRMLRNSGRFFSKCIPSGISLPIMTGPLRGARWIAGAAAGKGKGLAVLFNLVEPEQLKVAVEIASEDGDVFDIGANVGFYTILFARNARHVFAFEPFPQNIRYLSQILTINRLENVTIVPCAVSNNVGFCAFEVGENCATGKLTHEGKQPVMTISCDEFVDVWGCVPALLKIDVEGAELQVLHGAKNLLSTSKPAILLSTHGEFLRTQCLEFLKSLEYQHISPLNHPEIDHASEFVIMGK